MSWIIHKYVHCWNGNTTNEAQTVKKNSTQFRTLGVCFSANQRPPHFAASVQAPCIVQNFDESHAHRRLSLSYESWHKPNPIGDDLTRMSQSPETK